MWNKIVGFFMSIIMFFLGLFGIDLNDKKVVAYEDLAYGTHSRQVMDVYFPKDATGEVNLILLIHGGAWIAGDKKDYGSTAKSIAASYPLCAASINYRYLSEQVSFEEIMEDIDLALGKIKATAAEKGISVNKVILGGQSAGAHLALLYAYSRGDTAPITPVAVADYCGPTDFTDPAFYEASVLGKENVEMLMSYGTGLSVTAETIAQPEVKAALLRYSPIAYVGSGAVPTIINHGRLDDIVPFSNAQTLHELLEVHSVEHIFNIYDNSGHSLSDDDEKEAYAYESLVAYCDRFLY